MAHFDAGSPSRKSVYLHRCPARRQLLGYSGVRFRAISVPKGPEIGPQSTPEAVDEAIALKNTPEPILRSKRPVVRPGGAILEILSCIEILPI